MVLQPIHEITKGLRDTAEGEGDLTKRLRIARTDEIGMLAQWFNTFVAKLNNIVVDISSNSETVTASAFEVLNASEQMQHESDGLKSKAGSVAVSSEEMRISMNSVAVVSEQSSTNLGFVAEAATEMKSALDAVVSDCNRAKGASRLAADQVKSATAKVSLLGEAAREISKVSEVITEIADQTNLLALNATIEAARAGDAGKGFAVVAGEIKVLAAQTQQATQQIKARIQSIQETTSATVQEVGLIVDVIAEVDGVMSAIATSMMMESGRASEVAQSIEQASLGILEVNDNVAKSSQVSARIARDIAEVNDIANLMSTRSSHMRDSSEGLSELATDLRKMISVFKISRDDAKKDKEVGSRQFTGPELFPWNSRLIIGIDSIDEQHRKLVMLINDLHQAMKSKVGTAESGRILDELAEYTRYHFDFEEKLFDHHTYPAAAAHVSEHRALVEKVNAFREDFRMGRAGLSMDLMYFLSDWLRQHIMKTDKAYVPFFKGKKV
jgi:hemerythrin-like metal-binding protein